MKALSKKLSLLLMLCLLLPLGAQAESYPAKMANKLSVGLANVVTGVAEIPKTMIITTNAKGPLYGMTAGFVTGLFHMTGRTLLGAVDTATFMIPTQPVIKPNYIWKNFDRETRYFDHSTMR